MKAGVIGLGDMGSGIAKNLMKNGFTVTGLDLDTARMEAIVSRWRTPGQHAAAEVGAASDAVFVMVMNGDQAKERDPGRRVGLDHGDKGRRGDPVGHNQTARGTRDRRGPRRLRPAH